MPARQISEITQDQQAAWGYRVRYWWNPVLWCLEQMGVHLYSKQRDVLNGVARHRKVVVPSGHGCGKTFVLACLVLWYLFVRSPCKVVTTAPTVAQVKNVLWGEINSLFQERLAGHTMYAGVGTATMKMQKSPNWFATGISPREAVNFQGYHQRHVLVVFDEAPGVRDDIDEAADSLTSAGDCSWVKVGNPTSQSGHFFNACRDPRLGWHQIHISCLDTPNFTGERVPGDVAEALVNAEWVAEKRRIWGEDSPLWRSRVLGMPPLEDEDALIPLSWVEEATRREVGPNAHDFRAAGLDVARRGSNRTVLMGLFGDEMEVLESYAGKDLMRTVGTGGERGAERGITRLAIDDVGVGGGVTDRINELRSEPGTPERPNVWHPVAVQPVNVGDAAVDREMFFNRRSELWWNLREWIRTTGRLPDSKTPEGEMLAADLTAPRYEFTSKRQIKLEPKVDTEKRLGNSPDHGDAAMLALSQKGMVSTVAKIQTGSAFPDSF